MTSTAANERSTSGSLQSSASRRMSRIASRKASLISSGALRDNFHEVDLSHVWMQPRAPAQAAQPMPESRLLLINGAGEPIFQCQHPEIDDGKQVENSISTHQDPSAEEYSPLDDAQTPTILSSTQKINAICQRVSSVENHVAYQTYRLGKDVGKSLTMIVATPCRALDDRQLRLYVDRIFDMIVMMVGVQFLACAPAAEQREVLTRRCGYVLKYYLSAHAFLVYRDSGRHARPIAQSVTNDHYHPEDDDAVHLDDLESQDRRVQGVDLATLQEGEGSDIGSDNLQVHTGLPEIFISDQNQERHRAVQQIVSATQTKHVAVYINSRIYASSQAWSSLHNTTLVSISTLLQALPPALMRDIPIYLLHSILEQPSKASAYSSCSACFTTSILKTPVADLLSAGRGQVPYRLLTIQVAPHIEILLLCGSRPSLVEVHQTIRGMQSQSMSKQKHQRRQSFIPTSGQSGSILSTLTPVLDCLKPTYHPFPPEVQDDVGEGVLGCLFVFHGQRIVCFLRPPCDPVAQNHDLKSELMGGFHLMRQRLGRYNRARYYHSASWCIHQLLQFYHVANQQLYAASQLDSLMNDGTISDVLLREPTHSLYAVTMPPDDSDPYEDVSAQSSLYVLFNSTVPSAHCSVRANEMITPLQAYMEVYLDAEI